MDTTTQHVLSQRDLASFVTGAVANGPALDPLGLSRQTAERVWGAELERLHASQVQDPLFVKRYAQGCPCPQAREADYLPRIVRLDGDLQLLGGIHHDGEFFVHVYAANRRMDFHTSCLHVEALLAEFDVFLPYGVRAWQSGRAPIPAMGLKASRHVRLIVGSTSKLAAQRPAAPRVALEPVSVKETWEAYLGMYERHYALEPEMRHVVRTESRGSLARCRQQGALFRIRARDRVVGLLAAAREIQAGIEGWCIVEEIIDPSHRGLGYAAEAQRLLCNQLPPSSAQHLVGTIDARNRASIRTALHAGRRDVGGWVTLRLPPR